MPPYELQSIRKDIMQKMKTRLKQYLRAVLVALISMTAMTSALADEVRLDNGDRLTGKVVRLQDGELVFETDPAGEIGIDWSRVVYLKTDEPVPVFLQDGTMRDAQTFVREAPVSETQIGDAAAPAGIAAADVKGINIEPRPPVKVTARVNAGISTESGNTDTEKFNLDGEFIARTLRHRFTFGGVLNREKADGDFTAKNWRGYGLYDYFFLEKWFLYASALLENDEFADLDLRATYGGGVGHQFFESDTLNLSASVGAAYVSEDFIVGGDDEFSAAQWVIRYDQYFFDKFVQLFHDDNGYISFEDSDNWLINTRQGLRFPFYKGFVLTLQYNYDYNNQPSPDATSKWDSQFLLLLGYTFKNG